MGLVMVVERTVLVVVRTVVVGMEVIMIVFDTFQSLLGMQFVWLLSFVWNQYIVVYSGVAGGHGVGFGYCLRSCTLLMSCKFGGVWTPPPFMSKSLFALPPSPLCYAR